MSEDLTQRRTRVFSPSIPRHKSARHAGGRFHRGGHVSKQRKERKETKEERTDREREKGGRRAATLISRVFAAAWKMFPNFARATAKAKQETGGEPKGAKGGGGEGRGKEAGKGEAAAESKNSHSSVEIWPKQRHRRSHN